jgi:hypothetical protein
MARRPQRTPSGVLVGNQSTAANFITPKVTLRYVARSHDGYPHIRVTICREHGSVGLKISYATIAEICEPSSDRPESLVQAFRQSLPELWRSLNAVIANAPSGSVVFVTPRMLRSHKISAARNQPRSNKMEYRPAISPPKRAARSVRRSSVKSESQIESRKTATKQPVHGSTRKAANFDAME